MLNNTGELPQNIELIVLQNNDYKLPQRSESKKSIKNGFTIPEDIGTKTALQSTEKSKKKVKPQDNFEDMLYFVCNSCPFLCTKDTKITEHVENAHRNKTIPKLVDLKCPACPNIFYSKISLKSHLIHDHGVGNSELSSIIQVKNWFECVFIFINYCFIVRQLFTLQKRIKTVKQTNHTNWKQK